MGHLVTVVVALLLGFLAGLLSFKVKSRWCASCGMVKSCPRCAGWADSRAVPEASESTTAVRGLRGARSRWWTGARCR